jgi:hypothetical protein
MTFYRQSHLFENEDDDLIGQLEFYSRPCGCLLAEKLFLKVFSFYFLFKIT